MPSPSSTWESEGSAAMKRRLLIGMAGFGTLAGVLAWRAGADTWGREVPA